MSLVVINATLYAVLGYLTFLGVFAPVVGTVRFWPSVFIPAVFAIAFSPLIGGLGAAIGIFISDMLIHGNALLSLSVGVPANFLGFYAVGLTYRRVKSTRIAIALVSAEILLATLLLALSLQYNMVDWNFFYAAVIAIIATLGLTLSFALLLRGEAFRVVFAGSTGLMLGSVIIGVGVWLFSQYLTLPTGQKALPAWAALVWFLWTYLTEIPFIALLAPPLVSVLKRVGFTWGDSN
ncbi:hypothetical protein IG193_02505 [Infirmifilum lucidum]|uniref:QueT transporter family protein n=1 Tax=Infirmifilum lucidum TaxID=2776706 RepID=A0A7L9FJ47_9CREN|nr:hypothetical protein IG193_02505 [Infirmifilum lucidum]